MDSSKPLTETELILGYAGTPLTFELGRLRFSQCVCGAWLGLDSAKPESVEMLIESHVGTAKHAAWRKQHLAPIGYDDLPKAIDEFLREEV